MPGGGDSWCWSTRVTKDVTNACTHTSCTKSERLRLKQIQLKTRPVKCHNVVVQGRPNQAETELDSIELEMKNEKNTKIFFGKQRAREREIFSCKVSCVDELQCTYYIEACDEGVSVGRLRCLLNPLHARVRVPLGDVLAYRSLEQNWFLADVAHLKHVEDKRRAHRKVNLKAGQSSREDEEHKAKMEHEMSGWNHR